jgi:hypothetical protein
MKPARQSHLIVAHQVVNDGHDRAQRPSMTKQISEATGSEELQVLADRGDFSGEQIPKFEHQTSRRPYQSRSRQSLSAG